MFSRDFFKNGIVSPKHAYICGLFLTDGNCNLNKSRISWKFKYSEHNILIQIRKTLDGSQTATFGISKVNKKCHPFILMNFNGYQFANDLNGLSLCEPGKKTYNLPNLTHLENDFVSSLILGIIDGDGSWNYSIKDGSIRFYVSSASREFLKWIQHVINKSVIGIKSEGCIHQKSQSPSVLLQYTVKSDVYLISKWMYQHISELDGLYMERKYHRTLLANYWFENNLKRNERRQHMKYHIFNEVLREKRELYDILRMCKGEIPKPDHFHFSPSFVRYSNRFYVG